MSKSLEDALGNGAWSVSKVIFDVNDILDEEGRPVSERRADAPIRAGVEMDMRPCPYSGIRQGQWMNASALVQLSRYYTAVMAEIAAFRRQNLGINADWPDIMAAVLDQLAQPALHLLQQRELRGPVPAKAAVGHKLAAGFFGVMRSLHERRALGTPIPVTTDAFLALVDETKALVGKAEVCAGSPQMIRKASTILIEGDQDDGTQLPPERLEIARCLALQVQLGIHWRYYDELHVWKLIRGETRPHLTASTLFLSRKLTRANDDISPTPPPAPDASTLPERLEPALRQQLALALREATDPAVLQEDVQTVTEQLVHPGNALRYGGPVAPMALQVAHYLHARRTFLDALNGLEHRLRGLLGYDVSAPIALGGIVFPLPQALPWYELIVGRRVGESGHMTGNSVGLRSTTAETTST